MAMNRIRLELARSHDFPDGSRLHGYDFTAPLDAHGHLDAAEWHNVRDRCVVKHFWGGAAEESGLLVRRPGGSWVFDYDPAGTDDNEAGFKFDKHQFLRGQYVSITEHDGDLRTFRVVSVHPLD